MNASIATVHPGLATASTSSSLAPLPDLQSAMAASYRSPAEARAAEQELRARWGLRATLLTAPLTRMQQLQQRLTLGRLPLALALLAVLRGSRLAFDALVARARRRGHAVLVVPQVPSALHDDVAALLVATGVSWWDGSQHRA